MYLSASQIKTYLSCKRKWLFDRKFKIYTDSSATLFGKRVHGILEDYYSSGKFPTDKINTFEDFMGKSRQPFQAALNMIRFDRQKADKIFVEKSFKVNIQSMEFVGFIDLMLLYKNNIHVIDHKTSTDPKKWALSEEDLQKDPQKVLYLFIAMWLFRKKEAQFTLNYGDNKRGDGFLRTTGFLSQQKIVDDFNNLIMPVARDMYIDIKKSDPNGLKPNYNVCYNYGGCPYYNKCAQSRADKLKGILNG